MVNNIQVLTCSYNINKCKKFTKQHTENYPISVHRMEIKRPPKYIVIISEKEFSIVKGKTLEGNFRDILCF